ncbi:MAG: C-GCAxxG-C-C family protein [Methanoregula sp.]|nr:C-GCAxxG-C-C family protein [Methanoregula sp.]
MPEQFFPVHPAEVRKLAEECYRTGQFSCSEAIVKTINEAFALGYPDSIIAVTSGFPIGIGGAGCARGAVTGGVMALGMASGRSKPRDPSVDRCLALARELPDLFFRRHGYTSCRVLTRGMVLKSPEHLQQCVAFAGGVAEETAKIIIREMNTPAGRAIT